MTFPIKFSIIILVLLQTLFLQTHADVDKDALPNVEEGFQINFFIKEPHIFLISKHIFDFYDSRLLEIYSKWQSKSLGKTKIV